MHPTGPSGTPTTVTIDSMSGTPPESGACKERDSDVRHPSPHNSGHPTRTTLSASTHFMGTLHHDSQPMNRPLDTRIVPNGHGCESKYHRNGVSNGSGAGGEPVPCRSPPAVPPPPYQMGASSSTPFGAARGWEPMSGPGTMRAFRNEVLKHGKTPRCKHRRHCPCPPNEIPRRRYTPGAGGTGCVGAHKALLSAKPACPSRKSH